LVQYDQWPLAFRRSEVEQHSISTSACTNGRIARWRALSAKIQFMPHTPLTSGCFMCRWLLVLILSPGCCMPTFRSAMRISSKLCTACLS